MAARQTCNLQIIEHLSGLGRWRMAQRSADPRLQAYVRGYLASEGCLPKLLIERHIPSLEVAIILNFASPHRTLDTSDPNQVTEHRGAWVVGLQNHHRLCEAVGERDFMVIRFNPIGAHLFLRTPMDLLVDRKVELEEIDGPFARWFTSRVQGAPGWAARFDLVESMIAERIASARQPSSALIHAWQRLQDTPSAIDLEMLSSQSGCSRRHWIAQFHRNVGMPPKMIARIRRFNLTIDTINRIGRNAVRHPESKPYLDRERTCDSYDARKPEVRWANIAVDCGYYDQSHFIKEFRAFAGLTPLEFLRQTLPDGTGPLE